MSSPIVGREETSRILPDHPSEVHSRMICDAIYLPGGQRIMTCSWDGSLRVWNLKSGKQIGDDWRGGDKTVRTIALSPDGKKVVSGSADGEVRLWDTDTGKIVMRWIGHTGPVKTVCWSGDGQRVLSGSEDGTARQWDIESGEANLAPLIKTGHKYVFTAVYSPDTTRFATGGLKDPVKIWDAKTGELVATLFQPAPTLSDLVWCLAWTPDGKTLLSPGSYSVIRIWDTTTWKQIAVLDGHTSSVQSIAISPNGRILASASLDKTVRLWNLDDNQPIRVGSPLRYPGFVTPVSFSANGNSLLATDGHAENAYTWDISGVVKEAGLEELLLEQHDESVHVRHYAGNV
ncbi:WD40-repeat-containing domain protein [Suillus tomentosus]|nr:WD40-repeat-containing domain protein [Suillus tomentosus]